MKPKAWLTLLIAVLLIGSGVSEVCRESSAGKICIPDSMIPENWTVDQYGRWTNPSTYEQATKDCDTDQLGRKICWLSGTVIGVPVTLTSGVVCFSDKPCDPGCEQEVYRCLDYVNNFTAYEECAGQCTACADAAILCVATGVLDEETNVSIRKWVIDYPENVTMDLVPKTFKKGAPVFLMIDPRSFTNFSGWKVDNDSEGYYVHYDDFFNQKVYFNGEIDKNGLVLATDLYMIQEKPGEPVTAVVTENPETTAAVVIGIAALVIIGLAVARSRRRKRR